MSKSDKNPIEEQLQYLVEKFEGENKALRKILMSLEQSKDQSQIESSEVEKDSTLQPPKKGKDKKKRNDL